MRWSGLIWGLLIACGAGAGCGRSGSPAFRLNSVELLRQERQSLAADAHFPDGVRDQIGNLVTAFFGTPDEPRFPFPLGEDDPARAIIDPDKLMLAAGPVQSDRKDRPSGLYREHCAHCHGISGDGAGPTAGMLNPYPRDFRLGKFKFKSTPLRSPPTDADLAHVLRTGIPGTGMPAFSTLPVEHVEALVHYVKYLAIRGTFERRLMEQLPQLDGEPLVDLELLKSAGSGPHRALDDALADLTDTLLVEGAIDYWLNPDRRVTVVPPVPPEMTPAHSGHAALLRAGQLLYRTRANCVQCHGETGLGDGQAGNFDDWTNEWMKTPGVDPNDPHSWREYLAAGALPPRNIRPRNLNLPVYRGGGSPEVLFLRIRNGIEGTPMPSSPILSDPEVWAVVAWVRNMPYQSAAGGVPALSGTGSPAGWISGVPRVSGTDPAGQ